MFGIIGYLCWYGHWILNNFKDKHNINFYKSQFIGKLRIPYILDKYSLKRINKLKIVSTFYSEYYIQDYKVYNCILELQSVS